MDSLIFTLAIFVCTSIAQFNLWPSINADTLASGMGLSIGYITALNETIGCDPTLFQRTNSIDYFFWSTDNITVLCTSECESSAASWNELVVSSCANETFAYNGKAVDADTISGRYVEGFDLACTTSSTGGLCLVESQDWQGSGMLYNEDGTLADNQSLTMLYDETLLCDKCFISMLTARINSSYLANSVFNTYMTAELGEVLDFCEVNSTNTALNPYTSWSSTVATTTPTSMTSSTGIAEPLCTGQVMTSLKLKERQLLSGTSAFGTISQQCQEIATDHNVPTGAVIIASGNQDLLGADDSSCDLLADQLTVAEGNVTTTQLLAWNPLIIGTCDNLQLGQYVCISPPGGAWVPAIANLTNGTIGDSGGVTQTFNTGTPTTAINIDGITTLVPVQTGIVTSCDVFYLVEGGDSCDSVVAEYGISLDQFYDWNPAVNTDCSNLELGIYVCVDVIGAILTTANTITTPSPIQTGMVTDCDKFYDVQSGNDCDDIASLEGIPLASLYAWNPAIGPGTCDDLFLGFYVCVGVVPATSTTALPSTTTSAVVTPTPIQTGMVFNCDDFYQVQSGDDCADIASKEDISLTDFYDWNPAVGLNTCATLFLGYYVCIGIS